MRNGSAMFKSNPKTCKTIVERHFTSSLECLANAYY